MLCLTQTTGYALKALGCLTGEVGRRQQTADIAKCAKVPRSYLSKIIQSLTRAGLVAAKRGIGGGISLARPPEEISVRQVVEAVEGKDWLGECLLSLDKCTNLSSCPTHDFWLRIRQEIKHELDRTSLVAVIALRDQSSAMLEHGGVGSRGTSVGATGKGARADGRRKRQ